MQRSPRTSLSHSYLRLVALLSGLSLLFLGGLWLGSDLLHFESIAGQQRRDYLAAQQQEIKHQVEAMVATITAQSSILNQKVREDIRERVEEAWSVANSLYEHNLGRRSEAEIAAIICEALRPMRYHNGRGYFFIINTDGVLVLFADEPGLEGQGLLGFHDMDGRPVVRDILNIGQDAGEGFYAYRWFKPGAPGWREQKLAFVKFFPQLNWIIGTGEYLEDTWTDLKQEAVVRMAGHVFGDQGYFFAGTFEGMGLVGPTAGMDVAKIINNRGQSIVPDLIRAAQSGGDFVEYYLPFFPGQTPHRKLSYVSGLLDWNWYIGAGVNLDAVEEEVNRQRERLWAGLQQRGIILTTAVFLLLSGQYVLAQWAKKRLVNELQDFMAVFSVAESEGKLLDLQAQKYAELYTLALAANAMIKARIQAEQALRESEARYRRLVDNAYDAIFLLDHAGRILDVNQVACDQLQIDFKTLTSLSISDIHPNVTPAMIKASLEHLRTQKSAIYYDISLRSDGTTFPSEVHLTLFEEDGRKFFLGLARDITERHRAEEQLRQSEDKFVRLFQFSPIPVFVIHLASEQIVEANAACTVFFGLSREKMLAHTTAELDVYQNPEQRLALLQKLRANGSFYNQSAKILGPDKIVRTCLISSTILVINDEEHCLTSFQDITEQEKMQEVMLQTEKMVSVGGVAAGIAHEINNPLAIIVQMAQNIQLRIRPDFPKNQVIAAGIGLDLLLLDRYLTERNLHVFIEEIYSAGTRAANIVRHMLDFSRQPAAHHGQHDLRMIIDKAVALAQSDYDLKKSFDLRQIKICVSQDADLPLISCSETEVEQVIFNILRNASQAMAMAQTQDPEIIIYLSKITQGIRIIIKDNGPGISPEIQRHIFEPFYTTKAPGQGTGLGLSVSYFIITQAHQGSIAVDSQPGQGTSFIIELPIMLEQKESKNSD